MPKKKVASSTAGAKSARKGAVAASTKRQTSKPKSKPRTTGARKGPTKPRAKASAAKASGAKASAAKAGRAKTPSSTRAKAKARPARKSAKKAGATKTPAPKPENASQYDLVGLLDSEPAASADPVPGPAQTAEAAPDAAPALAVNAPAAQISVSAPPAEGDDADGPEAAGGEDAARPNTLVPTNAVHRTKRRLKRPLHHNRPAMAALAAAVLGVLILVEQAEPPDVSPFEREYAYADVTPATPMIGGPQVETTEAEAPQVAAEARHRDPAVPDDPLRATATAETLAAAQSVGPVEAPGLAADELAEIERLLARLDLGPSHADGVVDFETKNAIRLYQEIAGLPVDGEPSEALLEDMREVVKIMDSDG